MLGEVAADTRKQNSATMAAQLGDIAVTAVISLGRSRS
jgi:hypothetical protein